MTDVCEFDAAYHLDNPKVIAAYIEEAFETGDNAYIAHAFRTVARARGMEEQPKNLPVVVYTADTEIILMPRIKTGYWPDAPCAELAD